jgi:presequence protease
MTKIMLWIALIGIAVVFSASAASAFHQGETYHGFKLLEKKFVKEVNAECLYFEHVKSGARLLKIAAADANKTFSIAFKTIPESDCGTPHIMEHSVLNGSRNFPVKSPFDVLAKGSLNTFLNAMTGSDVTIYPVASMNNKDYFNLMHVYLDAVFYPLIYDDPRILQQEGWHYELTEKGAPVTFKGVVYNEMKGSFSNPSRELNYQICRALFPDVGYGFSSGGHPNAIPSLTNEAFLNFHRTYYHPSNSYIFLYGDADLEKELEFIDSTYLSKYERSPEKITITKQPPFDRMKEIIAPYPVAEDAGVDHQTYLSLNWVVGSGADRALVMALQVLQEVLVQQESAPVRLALQEAGIGREVNASVDDLNQVLFQIIVQNANAEDKDAFLNVVTCTLRDVAEKGLDKAAVEGAINRMEFQLREGNDAQKGLTYNFQALSGWFYADDPFLSLEYEKPLAAVKTALTTDYLESLIKKYLLGNLHSLLLALNPQPGLEKEITDRDEEKCAAFKETLSDHAVDSLIQQTQKLIAYQQQEDSPEALATIPMLELKDINPQAEWYAVKERKAAGLPVLHYEDFTNNVVYLRLYFDMRVLPAELLPYAALLAEVMGSLNTQNYTYGALDNELNLHTGGFNTYLSTFLEDRVDSNLVPKFVVSSKAMNTKTSKMLELIGEIVKTTNYADKERLKAVLVRHQSRLDDRIKSDGLGYARTRLASYYGNEGMVDEITNGLEYYRFITNLANSFDSQAETISANLMRTAALLFTRHNLLAAVTCQKADYHTAAEQLAVLIKGLPSAAPSFTKWSFAADKKNEGLLAASKVQYVVKGYDFKKLGYSWDGRLRVLNQVLSTDYLHTRIRVVGGAYGGFSSFSPNGSVYFASYRDPNLGETLQAFNEAPEFLHGFEADTPAMTRFIIGAVARMDRPLTPSDKGDVAVRRYFERTVKADVQRDRDAVLAATAEDIRNMEKLVSDILAKDEFCVYGNEEKLTAEKALFGELTQTTR